jgi:hypothetical protein
MKTSRRTFLELSGATAGAAAFAGGSDSALAVSSDPTVASLQQYLSVNAFRYLALPPTADEIPTIGISGPLSNSPVPATTLPGGMIYPISHPLIGGPIRQYLKASLAGSPVVNGYPCLALTRNWVCKGVAKEVKTNMTLRFKTDARVVEIAGVGISYPGYSALFTLMVDGRLVPSKALGSVIRNASGGWAVHAARVDFGYRAVRDIWVQTDSYVAYVKIDAGDSMLPVGVVGEPQLTVIGDSYLQARSAPFPSGGLATELGARLGIRNVAVDAIGGTGYTNSGNDMGNLNDRLPSHAADNSQIYVVTAGLNDYGDLRDNPPRVDWQTTQVYEQSVTGYLAALRSACPTALIVVTAPFCPVPPMSDASYVSNYGVNQSGLGDFLYKAQLHKRAVQQISGPWVHIDVLLGGGWLNSSGATGDVTGLQWLTGGTPGAGTSPTFRPGNTLGGAGGAFGGIASVPVVSAGLYSQAPEVRAVGGSGTGLEIASQLDSAGHLAAITVLSPGMGYSAGPGGLPAIVVDHAYELSPAQAGVPVLITPVNPNGQYPLPSFSSADPALLNNAPEMLMPDRTHPSPRGVSYITTRLAQSIFDAVMAM